MTAKNMRSTSEEGGNHRIKYVMVEVGKSNNIFYGVLNDEIVGFCRLSRDLEVGRHQN